MQCYQVIITVLKNFVSYFLPCEEEHGWDTAEAVRDEPCEDHPDQEAEERRLLGQLPDEF